VSPRTKKGLIRLLAQIVLFDGFDPLDAIAPYAVLAAGGAVADGMLEVDGLTVATVCGTARAAGSR
jgi:hypothetical protein